jgi:hypothetical protein
MNSVKNGIYRLNITTEKALNFVIEDVFFVVFLGLSIFSMIMPENIRKTINVCLLFYLVFIVLRNIIVLQSRVFIIDKYSISAIVGIINFARSIFRTEILNAMGDSFMNFLSVITVLYFAFFILENNFGVSLKLMMFLSTSNDKFIHIMIDEEGRGYLDDLKLEWENSGLTQNQINEKKLMFILDYYWGKFIYWMRLPRFLSPTKTR